jgi:hypothetical protein
MANAEATCRRSQFRKRSSSSRHQGIKKSAARTTIELLGPKSLHPSSNQAYPERWKSWPVGSTHKQVSRYVMLKLAVAPGQSRTQESLGCCFHCTWWLLANHDSKVQRFQGLKTTQNPGIGLVPRFLERSVIRAPWNAMKLGSRTPWK